MARFSSYPRIGSNLTGQELLLIDSGSPGNYTTSTITTASLSAALGARGVNNYQTGTFTMGSTGFVSPPSATATYLILFGEVVMLFIPNIGPATSNSTSFTLTGIPSVIQPTFSQSQVFTGQDNGSFVICAGYILSPSFNSIQMANNGSLTGWTASGPKFTGSQLFTYLLH